MTKEEMIKVENQSKELVENLKRLHDSGIKFQIETESLHELNKRLTEFVGETSKLSGESHEIIKKIKETSILEITDSIQDIRNEAEESTKKIQELVETNKGSIITASERNFRNFEERLTSSVEEVPNKVKGHYVEIQRQIVEVMDRLSGIEDLEKKQESILKSIDLLDKKIIKTNQTTTYLAIGIAVSIVLSLMNIFIG